MFVLREAENCMKTSSVLVRFHLISLLSTSIYYSEVVVIKHPIFAAYICINLQLVCQQQWRGRLRVASGARDNPLHAKNDDTIDLNLAICSIDHIYFYM